MKTKLNHWMASQGLLDDAVSRKTRVSRSHISRIRRGKSGANKKLALRLEKLTGIPWTEFIEPRVRA